MLCLSVLGGGGGLDRIVYARAPNSNVCSHKHTHSHSKSVCVCLGKERHKRQTQREKLRHNHTIMAKRHTAYITVMLVFSGYFFLFFFSVVFFVLLFVFLIHIFFCLFFPFNFGCNSIIKKKTTCCFYWKFTHTQYTPL